MTSFADFDASFAYSRMGGRLSERAVLIVDGQVYEDWETVTVKQEMSGGPPASFRFTCSEGKPLAKNYAKLKIKPGMDVYIYLAGYLVFSGKVMSRQVFYDAHRHHIEIQGVNWSFQAMQTSVISKTGEWRDIDYLQLAKAVAKPLNVPVVVEGQGSLPTFRFPRVSVPPGQYAWELLEQYARHVGAVLATNKHGDFVILTGPTGEGDEVTEGKNILQGREIMMNRAYTGEAGYGAIPAGDQRWGPETTSVPFVSSDPSGLIKSQLELTGVAAILNEIPPWQKDQHQKRINTETGFTNSDSIVVFATVYGWLKASGGVWGPVRSKVTVNSPMLLLEGVSLTLKSILFQQDNSEGTRTTLELCNDVALNSAGLGGIGPQG